jgi:hypothetical protein
MSAPMVHATVGIRAPAADGGADSQGSMDHQSPDRLQIKS